MRAKFKTLMLMSFFSALARAQAPSPSAVLNPASNIPASLPNGGIAEGSIFVVYGKNLGPAALAQAAAVPLPTTAGLAGTSVQVTVGGTTVTAPMLYTVATQIAGVLPSSTPVGTGTLTVTYNGASGSIAITVVKSNFGISTVNESGTGPGVITFPNYSVISLSNSAKPGDIVVIWGTGLGPITGDDAAIPVPTDLGTPIQVYVGGQLAALKYRGRSAGPGLDQINIQVPAGLSGCYIPVEVQNGTMVSNFTTIAIAPNGGACSDANGLPSTPSASGTLSLGEITLAQVTTSLPAIGPVPASTTTTSVASAGFYKFTAQQLGSSGSFSGQPSLGGCLVSSYTESLTSPSAPSTTPVSVSAAGLNAGPSISVAGPLSLTLNPLAGTVGTYSASATKALPAGVYTASNGAGGPDVGAFMTTINLSQPLIWTNQASTTTVNRAQGLPITWTGGDPKSYVVISGSSLVTTTTTIGIALFTCTAPVSAGQFTVPPAVLLSLPPSSTTLGIATGSLEVGSYSNPQTFTAPGLDYGFASSAILNAALVTYQ